MVVSINFVSLVIRIDHEVKSYKHQTSPFFRKENVSFVSKKIQKGISECACVIGHVYEDTHFA